MTKEKTKNMIYPVSEHVLDAGAWGQCSNKCKGRLLSVLQCDPDIPSLDDVSQGHFTPGSTNIENLLMISM